MPTTLPVFRRRSRWGGACSDLTVEQRRALLRRQPRVPYEVALATLLGLSLVWEADVKLRTRVARRAPSNTRVTAAA